MNKLAKFVSARLAKLSSLLTIFGRLAGFRSEHMGYEREYRHRMNPPIRSAAHEEANLAIRSERTSRALDGHWFSGSPARFRPESIASIWM